MQNVTRLIRGAKFAVAIAAALTIAACANKTNELADGAMNSAAPGSQQDFVVNVGDRVFFETDQTDLTPQARATLDNQAQWLAHYNRHSITIPRQCDQGGPP